MSTGGWKGIERGGKLGSHHLTNDQVEFVFWCLSYTPSISKEPVIIECNGKKFEKETITLNGGEITLKPTQYPNIKCPSIRLHWGKEKDLRNVSFSTDFENAYFIERGMGQEMVHIAGSVAKVGVNMIGGVYVDLVPMVPYLTPKPPKNYRKGNLPDPVRDGQDSAVECIQEWKPSDPFKTEEILRSQLGQLLWAGLGCTPHKTFRYYRYGAVSSEGQGKTIPSASAIYTLNLYVIKKDGIFKYVNWNEEKYAPTHSLGRFKKGISLRIEEHREGGWVYTGESDLLQEVKNVVSNLPKASSYVVIASNGRLRPYFSLMEAGYSILHMVLQARALNMTSNIVVLSQEQMIKIRETIGLIDTPIALIPISLT